MIIADLGDFFPELKGKRITGKAENGKLKPFDQRAAC